MTDLSNSASCLDLRERVLRWAPTMGESCWEGMAWTKPPERGVVFIVQGIESPFVRHIWSCADKPPLIDGRFFKEPNVAGSDWTLKELAEDIECTRALCDKLVQIRDKVVQIETESAEDRMDQVTGAMSVSTNQSKVIRV